MSTIERDLSGAHEARNIRYPLAEVMRLNVSHNKDAFTPEIIDTNLALAEINFAEFVLRHETDSQINDLQAEIIRTSILCERPERAGRLINEVGNDGIYKVMEKTFELVDLGMAQDVLNTVEQSREQSKNKEVPLKRNVALDLISLKAKLSLGQDPTSVFEDITSRLPELEETRAVDLCIRAAKLLDENGARNWNSKLPRYGPHQSRVFLIKALRVADSIDLPESDDELADFLKIELTKDAYKQIIATQADQGFIRDAEIALNHLEGKMPNVGQHNIEWLQKAIEVGRKTHPPITIMAIKIAGVGKS